MCPSIDNKLGIESEEYVINRDGNISPAECLIEALELCLHCSNSIFNNQHNIGQRKKRVCYYPTVRAKKVPILNFFSRESAKIYRRPTCQVAKKYPQKILLLALKN